MKILQKSFALFLSSLLLATAPRNLACAGQTDQSAAQPAPSVAKQSAEELQPRTRGCQPLSLM